MPTEGSPVSVRRLFRLVAIDRAALSHAARAQRINVEKLGGLPCISNPMRNTFAVNHSATPTDAMPMAVDKQIRHKGGGVIVDIRSSIANVFTGGMKLAIVLSIELGSREIGTERP